MGVLTDHACIAELIDNCVDGFLDVIAAGQVPTTPEVHVNIPLVDSPTVVISVRDNGPGMTPDVLEKAVRAGWSGNSSLTGKLGLFGMGFNIATARLGTVTTVWTSRAGDTEEVGVRIDFEQFRQQRHFKTPRLTRPKVDPSNHGTEVTIERLKPEQRQWFSKPGNRASIKKELSRVYSSMLRTDGVPLSFRLYFEGKVVEGRRHCVWSGPGNATRIVDTPRFGQVDAFQAVKVDMPDRPYCVACWQWLAAEESRCPLCDSAKDVVPRKRSIRGWLGVQRFLSESEFGIDFIRNGRKIEIASKDLFYWQDGEKVELEYPIDDPRARGRIVGEIHIDHCRVTYTKDRFERTDPAWEDMVSAVRGEGPLRPDKASQLGLGNNSTPLFKLFNVFRRSTPKPKVAGAWKKLLVVPDNTMAEDYARRFLNSDAQFQTDMKWWELIEEEEKKLLVGGGTVTVAASGPSPAGGSPIPGFGPAPTSPPPGPVVAPAPPPRQVPVAALTRQYLSTSAQKWTVQAFEVETKHPALSKKRPWALRATPAGVHEFFFAANHDVFASATMTPLDALLAELAYSAMEFVKDQPGDATFAAFLAELRDKYATGSALDPATLNAEARQTLQAIAQTLARNVEPSDAPVLFQQLKDHQQKAILQKMAARSASNPQAIIGAGKFLEYAPERVIMEFFGEHPELFLDSKCWDDPYSTVDYQDAAATELARSQVVRRYESLLSDAVWLAEQDPADLERVSRARLLRAMYALELLAPVDAGSTSGQ
jgi:histidine kinase/DNA gyrase B/HSP90-like ATPase